MINGQWGVGKTFLIKSFISSLKNKKSITSIYISLYGKSTASQIDEDIFQQLHPILGSKGVKLLGLVAKGLIKSATKIDLGKIETVTFNAELPAVDLKSIFPSPRDCLIVFDDLERCSMDIGDLMGYINSFVEHEGVKIVILADESKFVDKPEYAKYKDIKERSIGKTLEVKLIERSAIDVFINNISDLQTKIFLNKTVNEILEIHLQSETGNLRLLKQALWDFERISSCFAERHWKSSEAPRIILGVILALSYEIKRGRISRSDLAELQGNRIAGVVRRDQGKPATVVDAILTRYPEVNFDQTLLNSDILSDLLFRGWIHKEALVKGLDSSSYFASSLPEPAWRTALQVWRLSDEKIEEASRALEAQFAARDYDVPGEMFQVFGARLFLSEVGVLSKDKKHICDECIEYINDLRAKHRIRSKYVEDTGLGHFGGWKGYTFACGETIEFKNIANHYKAVVDEVAEESLPSVAEELSKLLGNNPNKFIQMISRNTYESGNYLDVAVLKYVSASEFADKIIELKPEDMSQVFIGLSIRYDTIATNDGLMSELSWLEELLSILRDKQAKLSVVSRFRIKNYCNRYLLPHVPAASTKSGGESDKG